MMKYLFNIILSFALISCQKKEQKAIGKTSPTSESTHTTTSYINPDADILKDRLLLPNSYKRTETNVNSWHNFLQNLKLEPYNNPILKYDGTVIQDQSHHVGILIYDVGNQDLQQCADALIRLRAEYLFGQKRYQDIGFNFTSGDYFAWSKYAEGYRPIINGNHVKFVKNSFENSKDSYSDFRKYLDIIFMYAGTISLSKELKDSKSKTEFDIGDLILTPGSPGHVVMIVDKIYDGNKKLYALVEGYTPAQSIHILSQNNNPWFDIKPSAELSTPRYYFKNAVFKRFE